IGSHSEWEAQPSPGWNTAERGEPDHAGECGASWSDLPAIRGTEVGTAKRRWHSGQEGFSDCRSWRFGWGPRCTRGLLRTRSGPLRSDVRRGDPFAPEVRQPDARASSCLTPGETAWSAKS